MDPVAADLRLNGSVVLTRVAHLDGSPHKVLLAMATASVATAATIVTNHL